MVLEGPILDDVAASDVPVTPEVFVDEASVIEYGVKLPVLFPRVMVLEGPVMDDVAASDVLVTPEVFVDEASIIEFGVKLPVPAPEKLELEGPVPLVLEDVAASDGTATPGIVVDWLVGVGNSGDGEVDAPITSVEPLLLVIARRWTCAGDARQ